jgi:hypothetical protein
MRKFYLLLPFIGQIDQAAAQTTPLFDSGASTIIGGNSGPYNNVVNINATSSTETFYFAVGTGNGSNSAPWAASNTTMSEELITMMLLCSTSVRLRSSRSATFRWKNRSLRSKQRTPG